MSLKTVRGLIYGFLIAIIVLMSCAVRWEAFAGWFLTGFMILAGAYAICILLFWRCPHCGRHLGRVGKIKYCMHCGGKLEV